MTSVEDYLQSLEKMQALRTSMYTLEDKLDLPPAPRSEPRPRKRSFIRDMEMSAHYHRAADELQDLGDTLLDSASEWEEEARPVSALSYRSHIATLRLQALKLEEKRLQQIRRLQALERDIGPQPKWYELKTPQFHKEAKKNNEVLAARAQWESLRNYTESVWKSKDFSRSGSAM